MRAFDFRGHIFIFKDIFEEYDRFICQNCKTIISASKENIGYHFHQDISISIGYMELDKDDITCSSIIIKSIIE